MNKLNIKDGYVYKLVVHSSVVVRYHSFWKSKDDYYISTCPRSFGKTCPICEKLMANPLLNLALKKLFPVPKTYSSVKLISSTDPDYANSKGNNFFFESSRKDYVVRTPARLSSSVFNLPPHTPFYYLNIKVSKIFITPENSFLAIDSFLDPPNSKAYEFAINSDAPFLNLESDLEKELPPELDINKLKREYPIEYSVLKLESKSEEDKVIDLNEAQVLAEPVKCWVRNYLSNDWEQRWLKGITTYGKFVVCSYNKHNRVPSTDSLLSSSEWMYCTLDDPEPKPKPWLTFEDVPAELWGNAWVKRVDSNGKDITLFTPYSISGLSENTIRKDILWLPKSENPINNSNWRKLEGEV